MRNAIDVAEDIVVPEPQNAEVIIAQEPVTRGIDISTSRHVVLTTINFDNKTCRIAREVDDEMIDWHLASEVEAACLQTAKKTPELTFGMR